MLCGRVQSILLFVVIIIGNKYVVWQSTEYLTVTAGGATLTRRVDVCRRVLEVKGTGVAHWNSRNVYSCRF